MTFAVKDMPWVSDPSVNSEAVATVRAGWSDTAFHAHVHVFDPVVSIARGPTELWEGDNVQFFLAGTRDLTGFYGDGVDGGAIHVSLSPPSATAARGRGNSISEKNGFLELLLDAGDFAAQRVTDGYEIEVQLPWAANAAPRSSGGGIGFNLIVGDTNDESAFPIGYTEGALANNPTPTGITCQDTPHTPTSQHPGCDDRTWCTPALE
jgi:cellulose/xylan binding protein with CBM9 domain